MKKLLLILMLLGSGCVSTDGVRDFTHGAAQGVIMQSDPSFYEQQKIKQQQEQYQQELRMQEWDRYIQQQQQQMIQQQQLEEMRRQTEMMRRQQWQQQQELRMRQMRDGY